MSTTNSTTTGLLSLRYLSHSCDGVTRLHCFLFVDDPWDPDSYWGCHPWKEFETLLRDQNLHVCIFRFVRRRYLCQRESLPLGSLTIHGADIALRARRRTHLNITSWFYCSDRLPPKALHIFWTLCCGKPISMNEYSFCSIVSELIPERIFEKTDLRIA